jgi:SulP family sulfate permease
LEQTIVNRLLDSRKNGKFLNAQIISRNALAGITTSLAMVPEVVAFALLAHVNPLVGLYAAFILGLVTSLFGGRPGLISGGAGSLAVVSVALVVSHGVEYLFACIMLMGIIQILFGAFKLGKLIKLVSPSVMTGFVNGLALIIFLAQFQQLKINDAWLQGQALISMLGLIAITICGVYVAPKITKHIPASLFGTVFVTMFVVVFNIETRTVGDIAHISGAFPTFHIPDVPMTLETLWIILPYSFILAAIGLIETLLTANLVDNYVHKHKPNHHTHPNKESMAQGAGNFLTGLFGGMGGCAMIGQTVINLESGGFHRLSGVVQSLCILAYILFASSIIESIPLAALVGVMFVVCYHTFDWKSFILKEKSKEDTIIMLIVTIMTVILNLAYAVILGVLITTMLRYIRKEAL